MKKLKLDYDSKGGQILIVGDISHILSDPSISLYMRQRGGKRMSESTIAYPCIEEDLQKNYQLLMTLFARINVEIDTERQLSKEIREIQRAEEDFIKFSKAAMEIWNANFNSKEFENFAEIIRKRLIGRNPYPLQKLAAYHLAFSQHSCNFSVPGSGKTTIVYAAYSYLNSLSIENSKYVNHLLVVGPLSSFGAWEKEFLKIYKRESKSKRLSGNVKPVDREEYLSGITRESRETEITLTSYPTLANNREDFEKFLKAGSRRTMMVLDEAHYIKSSSGVWSNNTLRLARYPASRVVLTGTPVPNGYEDLLNLFKFIHPDRNIVGFQANTLKRMSEGKMTKHATERLKKNILPFFTRIKKKDLGLPPCKSQVVKFEMDPIQDEIYRYIEGKIVPDLNYELDTFRNALVKAKLIRLRQAATNPTLLLKLLIEEGFEELDFDLLSIADAKIQKSIKEYNSEIHSSKLRELHKLIEILRPNHRKILIWSYFLGNLDLLHDQLEGVFEELYQIRGSTPIAGDEEELYEELNIETRESIIDNFINTPNSSIMIANPQAVGESISLHEDCHIAIYYDRDFNAGRFIQSKDRIHRYGLGNDQLTEYYYMVASKTIDEDIHDRLVLKEERLKQLIDSDDIPLFRIALGEDEFRQDIKAILRSYEGRKINT